jgi:Alr-MurF fusion protein
VAYPDEGIELRQAGVALPIMVMNTDENAFPLLNIHGLEPVIHSLHQLRALRRFLEPSDALLRIHIKLETGMHRLGFEGHEIEEMLRLIQDSRQLKVASVFTHLGASEDPAQDNRTRDQINLFTKHSNNIQSSLGYAPLRHVLNSCGILRHPAYAMDMVRLGIGLYGLTECPGSPEKPKSAIAMKTTISRIQRVPAGEGIGYGFKNPSTQDRRIATLAIGYADGLLRLAGEGRFSVMIEGKAAPTVGSICMDMCMVDISDIPEASETSEVIIFDENRPIRVLSEVLQTIPYEVLTNISSRIPRIYFNE